MLGERQEDVWRWVRGIPNVGMEEGVVGTTKLLDAEVVVVDETLEGFCAILHCPHFDTAAHAVKNHRDDGVVLFPEDGAVFGVVGYLPNAGRSLDKGLVSVSVVLRHEVVNRRVLIEIVGSVGFTLGGRTVADVVVGIGNFICRD